MKLRAAIIAPVVALIVGSCSTVIDGSPQVANGVIPNVIGMTERDALQALFDACSWRYVSRWVTSDTVPVGRIASVSPKPGTERPLNRIIELAASSGSVQTG